MDKAKNVLRYYVLTNRLKDLVRTGWKNWEVSRERIESVAEHVYGVMMLAIAMKSEYEYDVDLEKVLKMLAVHETEEIIISDLTIFDIDYEKKEQIGHEAIKKIFKGLNDGKEYVDLILEFDGRETKESKFAFFCDKLEADLQARIYDLEKDVDPFDVIKKDPSREVEDPNHLLEKGCTWGQMWMINGCNRNHFDEHFAQVSKCATEIDILKYKNDK